MASYTLTVIGYPASDSIGAYEWSIAGVRDQQLAAGRSTLTRSGNAASLPVERLTYHAFLAGLQALLAEDDVGALTIAAAPAKSRSCGSAAMWASRASSGCDGTLFNCSRGSVAS
jgi:hypothetical protein